MVSIALPLSVEYMVGILANSNVGSVTTVELVFFIQIVHSAECNSIT